MLKPEDITQVQQLIQNEVSRAGNRDTYSVASVPRHVHNGVDAPFIYQPYNVFGGFVPYDGKVNGILESMLPKGWILQHPNQAVTFTAGLAMGATTATLTAPWGDANASNYVLFFTFSNGDVSIGTVTAGSTSVSWTTPLTAAATASATIEATGQYTLVHNLGTSLYSVVASVAQSTNAVVVPVISSFDNEVDIAWFDSATASSVTNTSFTFILVLLNNVSTTPTVYNVNHVN